MAIASAWRAAFDTRLPIQRLNEAGFTVTTHSETTGDFNSAYTVKASVHSDGGPTGATHDTTTTIEAKWLGACLPNQRAGDIVMPGGYRMNIKDAEKMRAAVPKSK